MPVTADQFSSLLDELTRKRRVPGAQLAVLDGGTSTAIATGILNVRSGHPATPDALFLPGSIAKAYTATVVLALVEQEQLDLDRPVRTWLPEFRTGDEAAASAVTIRHLLSHSSGFDGDRFADTGRGDDALARYVEGCADLPQISPPGRIWSYGNVGYAILGRLVEVVTEQVWEEALRTRLLAPLGLDRTVVFPEEALCFPAAAGHLGPDPQDPERWLPAPAWGLPRSFGPMGTSVISSASEVLAFAQMHLEGGKASDGTQLLKPETVDAMQQPQITLVDPSLIGNAWGLGWGLDDWGGVRIVGHDGNSIGQNAFLRMAPDENFAVVLQTNTASALTLYRDLFSEIFGARLGVAPVAPSQPTLDHVHPADHYVGTYEREGLRLEITGQDQSLQANVRHTGIAADAQDMPPMEDLPLRAVNDTTFLLHLPIADEALNVVFFNPDESEGRPTYLHFGGRAARRMPEPGA